MDTPHKRFAEFARPIVEAARNVFETMVSTKIETQRPLIKNAAEMKGDVSSIINASGTIEVEGTGHRLKAMVVLSWPMPTYLKMASTMLMSEYSEYNEEIADVGAEIANIITTNAKKGLRDKGYQVELVKPSMLVGAGNKLDYPARSYVVLVPIHSNSGDFYLEIFYQEG